MTLQRMILSRKSTSTTLVPIAEVGKLETKNNENEPSTEVRMIMENDESMSHSTAEEEGADEFLERDHNNNDRTGSVLNNCTHKDDVVDDVDTISDNKYDRIKSSNTNSIDDGKKNPSTLPSHIIEIRHLKRRIKNVQEISIQTSRDSIASDLAVYQNNVLNATQNCVNEWRAIARHYRIISEDDDEDEDDEGISSALRIEVGLVVFQLIQLSVQSGPLSGAKPGYFKRCGAEVAKVVLDFLEEVVPQHDALGIDCMGFTSKQMDAMKKWMVNAGKAVENAKPPSKSMLKKMQQQKVHQEKLQQQKKKKKKKK